MFYLFPEQSVIVTTPESRLMFVSGEVVSTQKVMLGFNVAVDELLA
ncbi:MAG: hypothetical protein GDA43_23165 [Hormoscilla sp. SP5CHS1]|nr:hypothetical protein [Hormoscilla sp. SP5CHS1]